MNDAAADRHYPPGEGRRRRLHVELETGGTALVRTVLVLALLVAVAGPAVRVEMIPASTAAVTTITATGATGGGGPPLPHPNV